MEQAVTAETTDEIVEPVIPVDPMPVNVREYLSKHKDAAVNDLMSYIRTTESEKMRKQLQDEQNRSKEYKSKLEQMEGQVDGDTKEELRKLRQEVNDSKLGMAELRELTEKVANASIATSIGTKRMLLLAQVPINVLPPEMHSLVNGTTEEELQESLQLAVNSYAAMIARISGSLPNAQQFIQTPPQGLTMPEALQSPQNAGPVPTGSVPNSGTISQLAAIALRTGSAEDISNWQEAANQVINAELGR